MVPVVEKKTVLCRMCDWTVQRPAKRIGQVPAGVVANNPPGGILLLLVREPDLDFRGVWNRRRCQWLSIGKSVWKQRWGRRRLQHFREARGGRVGGGGDDGSFLSTPA